MDYIDYNSSIKKMWEQERKSHVKRLKDIGKVQSHRIDNKIGMMHDRAPCKNKRKDYQVLDFVKDAHLKGLKKIWERSNEKEIVDRIENICGYSTLSKKFRSTGSICRKPESALGKVSGNISFEKMERDFLRSQSYKKRISKAHLEKRKVSRRKKTVRGKLLEAPFLSLFKS